jgi:hypothetical protein
VATDLSSPIQAPDRDRIVVATMPLDRGWLVR